MLRLMPEHGVQTTVLVNNGTIKAENGSLERLKKIGSIADTVVRTGPVPWSLEERWLNDKLNGHHYFGPEMAEVWRNGIVADIRRTLGTAKFSASIDFDGYGPYMTNFQSCIDTDHRVLFMHNNIGEEMRSRFPHLQRSFPAYPRFTSLATVSQEVRDRNLESFSSLVPDAAERFSVIRNTIP